MEVLSSSTRLREEQLAGTLETLAGNPVSPGELCLGLVGFPFSFALVRALVYFVIVSVVIGIDLRQASWIGLIVVCSRRRLRLPGSRIAAAATVLVFKRADAFVGLVIGVLVVFSGSVFPISSLPDWLQPVAQHPPATVGLRRRPQRALPR